MSLSLFEKAFLTAGKDLTLLDKIVHELLKTNQFQAAQNFLKKANPSDVGTLEFNRITFKIDQATLPADQMLERARKFAFSGEASPEIFEMIVQMMVTAQKTSLAEAVIDRALSQYPDLRTSLYGLLEK